MTKNGVKYKNDSAYEKICVNMSMARWGKAMLLHVFNWLKEQFSPGKLHLSHVSTSNMKIRLILYIRLNQNLWKSKRKSCDIISNFV